MRTSTPFSPLRTLLLLLPFVVVPVVVILGTPRFGTLESHNPATASPVPAEAPTPRTQNPLAPFDPVSSSPSQAAHRETTRRESRENRRQPPHTSLAQRRWSAARSGQETKQNISRANMPDSLADADPRRRKKQPRHADQGVPSAVSKTTRSSVARSVQSNNRRAIETPEPPRGFPSTRVNQKKFPLGTSVSLSNQAARRAAVAEPAKREIDRQVPSPLERSAGQRNARVRVPEVLRAQQPENDNVVREAAFEQRTNLTWQEAQQQLERLGVTRYNLETWGAKGQYQFSCSVPATSNAPFNRRFEARANDPMLAIARVLDDVERWRQALESP